MASDISETVIVSAETVENRKEQQSSSNSDLTLSELRPRLYAKVRVGQRTDLGMIRDNNEDKYDLLESCDPNILASKGRLYGVADGMGGHSAGQIASELTIKTVFLRYFRDPRTDIVLCLCDAIEDANAEVFSASKLLPERQGMGTTLVLAVVWEDRLIVGHVGDSRLYLIRDQVPIQVTNDHSFVAEQVRIGAMTAEEAATSAMRNIILRSIGTGPDVEADVTEIPLQAGDVIVICSDGLSGHVSAEEIATYVAGSEAKIYGPSVAAHKLIDLANSRGGRDNITALIVEIVSIVPYESTL